MLKKIFFFFSVFISTITVCHAQDEIAMADSFRADGKIYVVIGVICILFIVLFGYLIFIDRSLTKKEKENP